MFIKANHLKKVVLWTATLLVLTTAFFAAGMAEATNQSGNKAGNFLGYMYVDSHNIKVFTDKGNCNPPREAVRIFRGTGTAGTRLTVDTTYGESEVDIETGALAESGGTHKGTVTTIRTVESFEPGEIYTVQISGAVRGNNNLSLGHFYFHRDIVFSFEAPDSQGNYTKPVSIACRPENGAGMVPWEGNMGFTVNRQVYNYEEIKAGLILKKNGEVLAHGTDAYPPVTGYPRTFFFFPMTSSGGSASYNLSADSEYALTIPPIKDAGGTVLLSEQTIIFHTTTADLPDKVVSAPVVVKSGANLNTSWNASDGATGYNIYVSTDPWFDFTKINSTPVTATSYTTSFQDAGLDPAGAYYIRVTAVNSGGETGFSPQTSTEQTIPAWAGGGTLTASNVGKTGLTLTWSGAYDNVGVTDYRIVKDGTLLASVDGNTFTYNVTGLSSNTGYTFKVEAGDADGNWSTNSPSVQLTTALTLAWNAASDDVGVTGYKLYKNGELLATANGDTLAYDVTGLTSGAQYTFKVEAGDAADNWTNNGPAMNLTAGAGSDTTTPSWPSGASLTAVDITQTGLTLTWSPAMDDTGVTGYQIYQDGISIGTVSGSVNTYNVTGLTAGASYAFKVEAGDADGHWTINGPATTAVTTGSGSTLTGVYTVIPATNPGYTIDATADGINTMTVNSGVSGSRDFTVTVSPVIAHQGSEKAVFVLLRGGKQVNMKAVAADFDTVNTATAGFEVQPGDVVKAYIVDDLYNVTDNISTILEH